MNKFIGLLCVWGSEDWVELAITQALDFCDEVIVSVGAYCDQVKKYEDRTLEICESFGNKIKIIPPVYAGTFNTTRAPTLNAMLKSSELFEIGNCVLLLDVDEFYHKSDIESIKYKLMHEGYNSVIVTTKVFFINMDKYIIGDYYRAWKITSKDCGFRPTNWWTGEMEPMYTSPPIMFHYTFLLNCYAKMDFWKGEYSGKQQDEKVLWMKDIYLKYDLNNEDYWLDENLRLFGKRRPSGPHDFGSPNEHLIDFPPSLKHPEIIENSRLRSIKDFRKIYTER